MLERVEKKDFDFLSKFAMLVNKCLVYRCLLCSKTFEGSKAYVDVHDHFRFLHEGEDSVVCFKCHKKFEVSTLCDTGWIHQCEDKSGNMNTCSDLAPS